MREVNTQGTAAQNGKNKQTNKQKKRVHIGIHSLLQQTYEWKPPQELMLREEN